FALQIYDVLDKDQGQSEIRAAILKGRCKARPAQAASLILAGLAEDRAPRQSMAARLIRETSGSQITVRVCEALPRLSTTAKLIAIDALADRHDRAAATAIMALCKSSDSAVRLAAVRAIGILGDDSAVPLLLSLAATGQPDERTVARASLARLPGRMADWRLLAAIDGLDS